MDEDALFLGVLTGSTVGSLVGAGASIAALIVEPQIAPLVAIGTITAIGIGTGTYVTSIL